MPESSVLSVACKVVGPGQCPQLMGHDQNSGREALLEWATKQFYEYIYYLVTLL